MQLTESQVQIFCPNTESRRKPILNLTTSTRSEPKRPAAEIGGGDFSEYIAYLDPFCFVVRRKFVDRRTSRFFRQILVRLLED